MRKVLASYDLIWPFVEEVLAYNVCIFVRVS